jgi:hypothetical protein
MPGEIRVKNEFGAQKLKFRLQAVPRLTNIGDRSNITLLRADSPLILKPQGPNLVMPGALVGRVEYTKAAANQSGGFIALSGAAAGKTQGDKPLDLLTHRALAVRLKVEGPLPKQGSPNAVLNIQLESGGRYYRDHYIDLDFIGDRTVIIPEPNTERMLREFRPAPANYAFKTATCGFNYQDIAAVNFRWMRHPAADPVKCTIVLVEALAETESVLKNPEISIGVARMVIPMTLTTGDYLEFWGEGPGRVFNRNGVQLSAVEMPKLPMLSTGENRISLNIDGATPAKLTTILLGEPLK